MMFNINVKKGKTKASKEKAPNYQVFDINWFAFIVHVKYVMKEVE